MEYYKPIKVTKKVEVTRSQHRQSGKPKSDEDGKGKPSGDVIDGFQNVQDAKKYPCFCCDRFCSECLGAKSCSHEKKKDGAPVNSLEVIDQKFEALKKAKQQGSGK